MTHNIEERARVRLSSSLASKPAPQSFQLSDNMASVLGLTSLNKVVFISSLCRELNIDLSGLTEEDLAEMVTLGNVIDVLKKLTPEVA